MSQCRRHRLQGRCRAQGAQSDTGCWPLHNQKTCAECTGLSRRWKGILMKHIPKQLLVWLLAVLMLWPWPLRLNAQSSVTTFRPEEIEQLVASIALYPDSLVSQILMASTYPLEIVQADRWARANKTLKGDALTAALEAQNW